MDSKLQSALERVLSKPKETVEVDMEARMKELKLDCFLPTEAWPPMSAVTSKRFTHVRLSMHLQCTG